MGSARVFNILFKPIVKLHQSDTVIELLRICISSPAQGARRITYPNKNAHLPLLFLLIDLNIGYSGRCIPIALDFHSGFYFRSCPTSDKRFLWPLRDDRKFLVPLAPPSFFALVMTTWQQRLYIVVEYKICCVRLENAELILD